MRIRYEEKTPWDMKESPHRKSLFYLTLLSSVAFTAALLTLLHAPPPAAHAAPPSQEPTPTPQIFLQDGFEDPASGWDVGNQDGGSTNYLDGTYVVEAHQGYWVLGRSYHSFKNVAVEVDATYLQVSDSSESLYGIVCRYVDEDNYYALLVIGDRYYGIFRMLDGQHVDLLPMKESDIVWQNDFKNHLRGVCVDEYLALYVNDRLLGAVTDDMLTNGDIGFIVANANRHPVQISFDNVLVTEPTESKFEIEEVSQCDVLSQEGMASYQQAWYLDALEKLQEALVCYRRASNRDGEGVTLNNIGLVYGRLGQYQEALTYHEQGLAIAREIGNQEEELVALNSMGLVYHYLAQYQKALLYYEQVLSICEEIGDQIGIGTSLNNIGGIYDNLGQYQKALEYYQRALTIEREIDDRAGEGITLNNIGGTYHSLANYQEALRYLNQALIIHQEVGDRYQEETTLSNIGQVYQDLGQYQEALRYLEQALAVIQEIGDRLGEGVTLNNIGLIYQNLGRYQEALTYHQQALDIRRDVGDRAGEGFTLYNIGLVYQCLGQYHEALMYYQQALAICQEIGDRASEGRTLSSIGTVYRDLGQYQEAIEHFERAIALIEGIRGEMTVEELKSSFAAGQMHMYGHIIDLFSQMERLTEAFDYVQRAKARAFLDQVGNARIDPRATDDPELVEQEQKLLAEIRALEAVLSSLNSEQRTEVQERLDDAYREYERTLTRIKLTNPEYASLHTVQASTLITIQQTLPPNVTLVEYYVPSDIQTLAFVVTQDSFHAVPLSVTAQSLHEKVDWFRQFPSLEGVPQASQELYNLLFSPLRQHIHTQALLIAPHSVLHYLPFSALHDGNHYLVEDYTIAYIPSASILQYVLEPDTTAPPTGLVLGNPIHEDVSPLPFAEQEAQAVANLLGFPAYLNAEATESRVWESAPQARYVHLAAHGSLNPVAPQFSRLYLTPDNPPDDATADRHDGYLELREVWNLPLDNADLVTLSACETQLGDLSAGDEIVGLNRAFIYAGTHSVLASLWSVDDQATKDLMVAFYSYLNEGYTKGEALRQAQIDTLQNPRTAHPYYWAGFMLTGDAGPSADIRRPSLLPEGASKWLLMLGGGGGCCACTLLAVLLALGTGIWIWRKNKRGG